MVNSKEEEEKTHSTCTRKALFDVHERDGYGRCERQKDGREECKEQPSNVCHVREKDLAMWGIYSGWGEAFDDRKLAALYLGKCS